MKIKVFAVLSSLLLLAQTANAVVASYGIIQSDYSTMTSMGGGTVTFTFGYDSAGSTAADLFGTFTLDLFVPAAIPGTSWDFGGSTVGGSPGFFYVGEGVEGSPPYPPSPFLHTFTLDAAPVAAGFDLTGVSTNIYYGGNAPFSSLTFNEVPYLTPGTQGTFDYQGRFDLSFLTSINLTYQTQVPEPSRALLVGLGIGTILLRRRR